MLEELKTFGGNLGCLKGKTLGKKLPHIIGSFLTIPITILERYKEVTLARDIMFINGIRFINTISRHIKFMMAENIANAEAKKLQESIRKVKQFYMQWVFKVTNILMGR